MKITDLLRGLIAFKLFPLNAKNMRYVPPGTAQRTAEEKLSDVKNLEDYAGVISDFEVAVDGGIGVINNTNYAFGNYEINSPGDYYNASPELLSFYLHNVGETPGTSHAKNLGLCTFTGTNLNKIRVGAVRRISSTGAGSTVAITGTGDFSNAVQAYKIDYAGAPGDGEIGGTYTVVRQGGTSSTLNDCSADLYNVSTYSPSFACLTEGSISKVNSSHVVTRSIRVQTGYLYDGINDMGGLVMNVETGAASHLITSSIASGSTATTLIRHRDLNRASGKQEIINWNNSGRLTINIGADMGGTAGDTIPFRTVQTYSSNKDGIEERMYRVGNGADYQTVEYRMFRLVDSSVGGGVAFGYEAVRGFTSSLTINGIPFVKAGSNQSIGFNGATPTTRPTLTAATDPASTQALANAIRTALINYGLAV